MDRPTRTILTVLCVLMILTLPLLVPSPRLLDSAVERMMDEMKKEMRGAMSATAAPVQNGSNANRGGNR